uniref:RNA-directed RNA polymerase n=1 Tax=Leviviridae sp. TaxID=2027243 RepID=A0A142D854_9VIRU|nr:replicase [Leviviridae sp.]
MPITRDERDLFRIFSEHIRNDLVSKGVSDRLAGGLLNWFDPAHPEYLRRIDAWQKCLCAYAVKDYGDLPPVLLNLGVIRKTPYQTYAVDTADPGMVRQVHQIAKLFYKFRGTPRKETDFEEARLRYSHPGQLFLEPFEREGMSCNLLRLRPPSKWEQLIGRFGPGITSDGMTEFGKWCGRGKYPASVPITLFVSNLDDYANLPHVERYRYGITKTAEVPKSLKSNRLISSEPAHGMFAQLAVGNYLVDELHRNFPRNISLYDQERHNRLLRMEGACSIDLSDASDHVSRRLVSVLMPHWKEFLFAVRSQFTQFPDGSICPLRTFAPMGSGVCFPVLTAISAGILSFACRKPWHAYGDDWIVHYTDYDYVIDLATRCGLVVNKSKSCCNLIYRESCGCELFGDADITPLYIRKDPEHLGCCYPRKSLEDFQGYPSLGQHVGTRWKACKTGFRPSTLQHNVAAVGDGGDV